MRAAHNLHVGAYPYPQTSLSVQSPPSPPQCDKGSGRIGCVSTPTGRILATFTPITADIDDRQQENIAALHNKFSQNK